MLVLAAGLRRGEAAPNGQLHSINEHVDAALQGASCALPAQLAPVPAGASDRGRVGGVSSFGYAGTIAHAVLRARARIPAPDAQSASPPAYRQRRFAWLEPLHPLVRGPPLRDEPGDPVTYRTPAAGALLALVADHVVQGRVVFPGAGYLEMARAACPCVAASGGAGGGAVLSRAFFLFLLEQLKW